MKPNGYVLWEGPSELDGAPIVVILTGTHRRTSNRKTGDMLQTWILRRDISPTASVKSGADASICGNCKHRGIDGAGRSCYVNVGQAPQAVWRAYQRGAYPRTSDAALFAGRQIRFGAYGDPAAAPVALWQSLADVASDWAGYTHQWDRLQCESADAFSGLVMASADTPDEADAAQAIGFRTFRVGSARLEGEKPCPAGPASSRVQCAACPLKCSGGYGANIVIAPHGAGAKHALTREARA